MLNSKLYIGSYSTRVTYQSYSSWSWVTYEIESDILTFRNMLINVNRVVALVDITKGHLKHFKSILYLWPDIPLLVLG